MRFHARSRRPSAFTLIELLVVVTIIVVLLAMLTPAMDQAIYQAELAVCGTHLRSFGTSLGVYAMDYRRRYPYRPGVNDASNDGATRSYAYANWRDDAMVVLPPISTQVYDDRIAIKDYVSLNGHLNCPLNKKLDIERSVSNTECPYELWYGFQFRSGSGGAAEPGMLKLGDRLQFTSPPSQGGKVSRFDLLACDMDDIQIPSASYCFGTHPDKDGILAPLFQQDSDLPNDNSDQSVAYQTPQAGAARFTISRWQMTGNKPARGALDRNFVHGDGSVSRMTDITLNDAIDARRGLAKVPIFSTGDQFGTGTFATLPLESGGQ